MKTVLIALGVLGGVVLAGKLAIDFFLTITKHFSETSRHDDY